MAEIAVIGDYDIRDRKLADATSKSSVETTDSIRMKDTDGNEVYIARDSFVDAVRSALGPILTNMTQKTAASGGVVVNDSNDVGTMNLSNLASLLGVELGGAFVQNYDLNNFYGKSKIQYKTFLNKNIIHSPLPNYSISGHVISFGIYDGSNPLAIQLCFIYYNHSLYAEVNKLYVRGLWSGWSDWKEI